MRASTTVDLRVSRNKTRGSSIVQPAALLLQYYPLIPVVIQFRESRYLTNCNARFGQACLPCFTLLAPTFASLPGQTETT
jgi:hypothetical protein